MLRIYGAEGKCFEYLECKLVVEWLVIDPIRRVAHVAMACDVGELGPLLVGLRKNIRMCESFSTTLKRN